MNDSILLTIKKLLVSYVDPLDNAFDADLILHINSVLSVLYQLGVGKSAFKITGPSETWSDFLDELELSNLEMIKTYVVLRVRILFDTPASSSISKVLKQQIDELEWRINVGVDPVNM